MPGTAKEVYSLLKKPSYFLTVSEIYESKGYRFRFTREGFLSVLIEYCFKRMGSDSC
jgi:hypothetical protein